MINHVYILCIIIVIQMYLEYIFSEHFNFQFYQNVCTVLICIHSQSNNNNDNNY